MLHQKNRQGGVMPQGEKSEFEIIAGAGNIILVAPHGCVGDDVNTSILVRFLRNKLNCYAVINEVYRRTNWIEINGMKVKEPIDLYCNNVDLNHIPQIETAGLEKKWLGTIEEFKNNILKKHNTCLVFFIHGAKDKQVHTVDNQQADILLGVGKAQTGSGLVDRPTATEETVDKLKASLQQESSMKAVIARASKELPDISGNKYAGWDKRNLNQLLPKRSNGFLDPTVQSIQLELKFTGLRDDENIESTACRLAQAIKQLPGIVTVQAQGAGVGKELAAISNQDEIVVNHEITRAADAIIEIVQNSLASGLIEVGNMLLKQFFGNDFQAARDRKKSNGNPSILQIHSELKYNAIKVAADSNYIKSRQDFFDLQTYVNLSASHKVLLESVRDDEKKRTLIIEAGKDNCSFIALKNKLTELKALTGPEPGKQKRASVLQVAANPSKLFSSDYDSALKPTNLKTLRPSTREKLKGKVASKIQALDSTIQTLEDKLKKQKEYLNKYQRLIKDLDKMS
ncbi:MAG: hypothetical protein JRJ37_12010 [Deltaproteobacteria bacterium]|nr:hypothetical protein [Deltaproteobacteria bacterium]